MFIHENGGLWRTREPMTKEFDAPDAHATDHTHKSRKRLTWREDSARFG